jgi:hypothetical protein
MLNRAISQWDKTITDELWPFAIQHAATIYNTTKGRSLDCDLSPWEQFTGKRSKLDQTDMHPLLCPVYVLDRLQEGTSPPKMTKRTTQKVYVVHLHHYSKSFPMVWDPKTKIVSPQFHVMLDDNYFNTVKAPDPNIKQSDTVARLFKTNRYTYYDPFGNEHTYIFTYGGADIHPDNFTNYRNMPGITHGDAMFRHTTKHFS